MMDLHCHLLPGLDDGPRTLPEAFHLAKTLVQLGYRQVIATPHNPWGSVIRTPAELQQQAQVFSNELRLEGISLQLKVAAEHHSSTVLDLEILQGWTCYPRGDTFLLEFPLGGLPPRLDDLMFRFQVKGKIPVIAHVERYPEVQRSLKALGPLKERGCLLLFNVSSLTGMWGREIQSAARSLVASGMLDAASTDLHSAEDGEMVAEGIRMLHELVGEAEAQRLLRTGPAKISGWDLVS